MAASSKTQKKTPQDRQQKVTSAREWKKASKGEPLELPSGNTALVRRPGMDKLLSMNLIPDSLTPIAERAVAQSRSGIKVDEEAEMQKAMQDPKALVQMFDTFDRITAYCVVEPKVLWHKEVGDDGEPTEIPDDERDDDLIYTDEVDQDDKMFIFQYVVGGTRDLESFREQQRSAVAGVSAGEDMGDQT